ncbi:hypothetical protein FRB96_005261 [Tulasnella sp. 330]|nr:hypothetical protein FRB96_005261 [Tulasnella sp. 330]KAG8872001.1 hypothetical protein FRB98_000350 [Tulasnella sp. 332]
MPLQGHVFAYAQDTATLPALTSSSVTEMSLTFWSSNPRSVITPIFEKLLSRFLNFLDLELYLEQLKEPALPTLVRILPQFEKLRGPTFTDDYVHLSAEVPPTTPTLPALEALCINNIPKLLQWTCSPREFSTPSEVDLGFDDSADASSPPYAIRSSRSLHILTLRQSPNCTIRHKTLNLDVLIRSLA